ncbi:MAG: pyridoxal-phosphate dependent enzyme [Pseudomonadota bacterium]
MRLISNPHRGVGLAHPSLDEVPFPSVDAAKPMALLEECPVAMETTLLSVPALAEACGIKQFTVKDERNRMGLGSFKALGAAYVIASRTRAEPDRQQHYVTASAGNHGLSVAAGAMAFRQQATIVISDQVPDAFAKRIGALGATVVRAGADYEASMNAAAQIAQDQEAVLLSDSSWDGYLDLPHDVMEGYLVLMEETCTEMAAPPSHIFLQAGVGGLAGAAAALAREHWGEIPQIIVVEPEAAPALIQSIEAGHAVETTGPESAMGRLDCKTPSLIALKGLARDADRFLTLTEAEGQAGADLAARFGLTSTPSSAAGLAGALVMDLPADAHVLVILSEGPEA